MTALVLVETVLLAILFVLVAGLLRAYATVLARLHDLDPANRTPATGSFELRPVSPAARPEFDEPTTTAHDVTGESPYGELVSARVVGAEHDTLLLFLSSGCSTCEPFWAELSEPGATPAGLRLLVVPQSAHDEDVRTLQTLTPDDVDVVLSSEAWTDYGVPGSPYAVLVDGPTGRVRGEGTGQSLGQVLNLLGRSADGTRGGRARLTKSSRDAAQELAVDRELLAAGIMPGDARLWSSSDAGGATGAGRPEPG